MRRWLLTLSLIAVSSQAHAEAGVLPHDGGPFHDLGLPDAFTPDDAGTMDASTAMDGGGPALQASGCGCSAGRTDPSALGSLGVLGLVVWTSARKRARVRAAWAGHI
jgi:MYXO-CTERM domain-containing protein